MRYGAVLVEFLLSKRAHKDLFKVKKKTRRKTSFWCLSRHTFLQTNFKLENSFLTFSKIWDNY